MSSSETRMITSNCHVRIAYAPNNVDTAKYLSDLSGKTTIVQKKRSRSHGKGGSLSDSMSEVARALMTPDECMSLPGIRKGLFGRVKPGDMLIFVAGQRPIYGRQILYFQDKVLSKRAAIEAPSMAVATNDNMTGETGNNPVDVYQDALRVQEAG